MQIYGAWKIQYTTLLSINSTDTVGLRELVLQERTPVATLNLRKQPRCLGRDNLVINQEQ